MSVVTSACSVVACSRPMSRTTSSPPWKLPGATTLPTFGACSATVTDALTAAPATSPVSASTPEGRSIESTGASAAFICAMTSEASALGSPWNPVPKSPSMMTSPSRPSSASRPAARSTSMSDPRIAAVRAASADGAERLRPGEVAQRLFCHGPPRPLHEHADVVPRLRGFHLVRRVERFGALLSLGDAMAMAAASSFECVIERSTSPTPSRAARCSSRPVKAHGRLRPA